MRHVCVRIAQQRHAGRVSEQLHRRRTHRRAQPRVQPALLRLPPAAAQIVPLCRLPPLPDFNLKATGLGFNKTGQHPLVCKEIPL